MKTLAVVIERHGPPAALVEREIRLPDPGPGEVHLAVEAAGVNFADLLMRAGLYGTAPRRPYSPGFEVAGRVARIGGGASPWREGDRAVALMRHGGYARDVVVPAGNLSACPATITSVQAAAVPVVFLTAQICLFEAGRGREGECALILGAGGGVGTAAVQLAVDRGLRVIGTAGDERKRRCVTGELGADACLDSRGDWEAGVAARTGERGVDLALDPVGGSATAACRRLLAPMGRLVFYGLSEAMPGSARSWPRAARAWLRTPRFHPLSLIGANIGLIGVHLLHLGRREPILRGMLRLLLRQVAEGRIRPIVDSVLPLDRPGAVKAHLRLHARENLGKVILARDPLTPSVAEPDAGSLLTMRAPADGPAASSGQAARKEELQPGRGQAR